jgi:myosin tail region-interacting protein MTI1
MADPPPKKIGSLRDRIAAFEKGGAAAPTPAPAPAPRPKPSGHVSWKPRPTSPPPVTEDTSDADKEKKAAGMSAADARAAIGAGGSLKERMAALQGRGGFGGAPPPVAPKPAVEKPKWKPPPVVSPPADEEHREGVAASSMSPPPTGDVPRTSQDQVQERPSPGASAEANDEAKEDAKEEDPEEEERQRRAAIAARMARLGGARVGMGPPVIGRKPDVPKKPQVVQEEEPKPDAQVAAESLHTPSSPDGRLCDLASLVRILTMPQ